MNDAILTVEQPKTFNQIAADQTIGGAAYGPAIAQYNGYADPATMLPTGTQIAIPSDWLGVVVNPQPVPMPAPASAAGALWKIPGTTYTISPVVALLGAAAILFVLAGARSEH